MTNLHIEARDYLKGEPIIKDSQYYLRYAANLNGALRNNEVLPTNADEFITARAESRVNRATAQTAKQLRRAFDNPSIANQFQIALEGEAQSRNNPMLADVFIKDGRLNSSELGNAFDYQLTSIVPFYYTEPTRGISYDFLPKISQGGFAGSDIKVQAYLGRQGKFVKYAENPTQYSTIEVVNKSIDVLISQLIIGMEIGVKETAFIAEYAAMAKYPNYNPNTGFATSIIAKMDYLDKYYKLTHDSIAWYGSEDSAVSGGAGSGFVNVMTTADINDYTAPGGNFSDLTSADMTNTVTDLALSVIRSSKNTMMADTLFIDLNSYTLLTPQYTDTLDSTPLQRLIDSKIYKAIIPVAAWSDIAPTQTTMIACDNRPTTWFYNMALPLTAVNPELTGFDLTIPYVTRTSGVSIINGLGLSRLTMPLGAIGQSFNKVKKLGRPAKAQ